MDRILLPLLCIVQNGSTPLILASVNGHLEVAQLLFREGKCNPHLKDNVSACTDQLAMAHTYVPHILNALLYHWYNVCPNYLSTYRMVFLQHTMQQGVATVQWWSFWLKNAAMDKKRQQLYVCACCVCVYVCVYLRTGPSLSSMETACSILLLLGNRVK